MTQTNLKEFASAFFTDKYSFIEVLFRPEVVGPNIASLGEIGVSLSKIDEISTHLLVIFVR